MVNYLMICRSLTYAQKAARLLERSGVRAIIQKAPQELTDEGCSYAVRVSEKKLTMALSALRDADMPPLKVLSVYSDGRVERAPV